MRSGEWADPQQEMLAADGIISDELGHAGVAVTMNFLEVDLYAKVVRYAGAVMPFPLLFRYGQSQPETITAVGMYVGDGYRRTIVTPNRAEVKVNDGDTILMFTDGIVEARDPRGRIFGQNGIVAAVFRAGLDSPEAVADSVVAAALAHAGRERPEDDQAILVIQVGQAPPDVAARTLSILTQLDAKPEAMAYELLNAEDSFQYLAELRNALMNRAARYLSSEQRRQEAWSTVVEAIQNALRDGSARGEVIRLDFHPVPNGIEIVVPQPRRWPDWDRWLGSRRPTMDRESKHVGTLTMLLLAEVSVTDQGPRVHLRFVDGGSASTQDVKTKAGDEAQELVLRSPEDVELVVKPLVIQGARGLGATLRNTGIKNLGQCGIAV